MARLLTNFFFIAFVGKFTLVLYMTYIYIYIYIYNMGLRGYSSIFLNSEDRDRQIGVYFVQGERERERNVLFNDALNTFYLRLYGVRHMVKDHSDSERGNPLPPHRLLFPISSKGSFICTIPQTG